MAYAASAGEWTPRSGARSPCRGFYPRICTPTRECLFPCAGVIGEVLRAGPNALPQPLVLVVEDNHATRVLLRATLEDAGCTVVTATNGRDAMLRLDELPSPPRLLLVDLHMPVMDGWELLTSLAQDPRWAHIPVGVQTANAEVTLPHGVSFVLVKPVDIPALLAFVRHHCG